MSGEAERRLSDARLLAGIPEILATIADLLPDRAEQADGPY